jgi:trans-aconitate methyltransferase
MGSGLFSKIANYALYKWVREPRGGGKPVPESALDDEYRSGRWDHFFSTDEQPRYDALLALIYAAHNRPRLLDIGCGSGRLAALLDPRRIESYLGVDLSMEGLARAKSLSLPHAKFEAGNFETWRPRENADLIVFNETIGYARDPLKVAREFSQFVSPAGALVVSYFRDGNYRALWERLAREFAFEIERVAENGKKQTWDLKLLRRRRA